MFRRPPRSTLFPTRRSSDLRIRAARPRHGHEVTSSFTPFEVGLAHEVHLDKGCFTGQEALMRLITYQDRKSTRLNSSHSSISYAVFCLKKKTINKTNINY